METTTPRPGVTAEALARMQFCAAALIAPASVKVAAKHIRKAVEAAKVLTNQLSQSIDESNEGYGVINDDDFRESVFGDRYPQLVQAAEQIAALSIELHALGEICGRLATESAFLPDDGPETWLRNNGHPTLSDIAAGEAA